jgi:hypothetical protein
VGGAAQVHHENQITDPTLLLQLVFASGYHKLVGKQVLFPQGFHCTGMPIKVRLILTPTSAAGG